MTRYGYERMARYVGWSVGWRALRRASRHRHRRPVVRVAPRPGRVMPSERGRRWGYRIGKVWYRIFRTP